MITQAHQKYPELSSVLLSSDFVMLSVQRFCPL
jgi:hypothetical protein